MNDWEAKLDERLRQVTLPPGLVARLQSFSSEEPSLSDAESALLSDDAIDDRLCTVELPPRLIERATANVANLACEQQLNSVPVPAGLLTQLRAIPWQLTERRNVVRWATAAALLFAVGLGSIGLARRWLGSPIANLDPLPNPDLVRLHPPPPEPLILDPGVLAEQHPDDKPFAQLSTEQDIAAMLRAARALDVAANLNQGAARDINQQFATGAPWQDLLVARWSVLGSPVSENDRLPSLEAPPRWRPSGFIPPLVRGFDRQFLLTKHAHPLVSPDAHADLRTVTVPLSTTTESFKLAWQRLREGKWPTAEEMHSDDFLAAMDYPLAATRRGELGLRVAAGPSPFGKEGAKLLQVAVAAGGLPEVSRSPVHLTVALDVSSSMNLSERLATAKASLRQMFAELGELDRVSLLLFNDRQQAEVVASSREALPELTRWLDQLQGSGGTNLAAGIQRGASLAMSETGVSGARRKLIVITDGRAALNRETHEALVELLRSVKSDGLQWSVIDLSNSEEADEGLTKLTREAEGNLLRPTNQREARWLLAENLIGRDSILAQNVSLRVTFHPEAVAAYRLIGHEPTRLAGLEPATVSISLRAGEVATGLFEIWLKPGDFDEIAVAEASWREPGSTGKEQKTKQRISTLQIATTFAEAPLSLQAAAIAAETGEVFKDSPFVDGRPRGLEDVQRLAAKVNPRLAERHGFREFCALIDAAQRLRVEKVTPK